MKKIVFILLSCIVFQSQVMEAFRPDNRQLVLQQNQDDTDPGCNEINFRIEESDEMPLSQLTYHQRIVNYILGKGNVSAVPNPLDYAKSHIASLVSRNNELENELTELKNSEPKKIMRKIPYTKRRISLPRPSASNVLICSEYILVIAGMLYLYYKGYLYFYTKFKFFLPKS
jgi:hypothetical protein